MRCSYPDSTVLPHRFSKTLGNCAHLLVVGHASFKHDSSPLFIVNNKALGSLRIGKRCLDPQHLHFPGPCYCLPLTDEPVPFEEPSSDKMSSPWESCPTVSFSGQE